jgi:hypothetical protein
VSTQAQPAAHAQAERADVRRRRFAALSDDLALKIFIAVATTVVLGRLGFDPTTALFGAALSPIFAEMIKAAAERRGLRRRHLLLATLFLFLVHGVQRALAAVRRRQPRPPRRLGPLDAPIARRVLLLTGAVASAITVAGFTVAQAVGGRSLPPDDLAPRLTLPANIVVESRGPRRVSFTVSAVDQRDGAVGPTCTPQPGTRFPIGKTRVRCEVVDEAGNRRTGAFTVTLVQLGDSEQAIRMRFPERVEVEATGPEGAVAEFVVTASDPQGEAITRVCTPPSGSLFPVGRTTVTCTARTEAETATRQFPVVVADKTPPRLTLPSDVRAETTREDRVVKYSVSASDRVDGEVLPNCSPRSGSRFSIGATPVRCSAADAHANEAQGRFTVMVQRSDDTTPPTLDLPDDRVAEATSGAGAVVTYDVDADDNRDDQPSVECSPPSGALFPLGRRQVDCAAVDAAGNRGTGAFTVTVSDTRPPKLTVPGDQVEEAVSRKGSQVSYSVSALDAVDGKIEPQCLPRSGLLFPLGTTGVHCNAQDKSGNSAGANFEVTVRDTAGPVIEVPGAAIAEATSASGARAKYRVSARDAVDGAVRVACSPQSGSMFPLGDTTVLCRAADRRENPSEKRFTVTVSDTTGPKVFPPSSVTGEAKSAAGARVRYRAAKAFDAVDGAVRARCSPRSGSTFALGETAVTCSATDRRGNQGKATFRVTVRDTTPPKLEISNMTIYIDSGRGTYVNYPPAKDAVDGDILPTCRPPSGSFFRVRTTTSVECVARDRSGNVSSTVSFTVSVHFTVG